jgi:hypothetical protein
VKAASALVEFEKALDSYRKGSDDDAADKCSAFIKELETACAPA